jgi:hypothetical protein
MTQLMSLERGKTAHHRETQIPTTVMRMKRGLKTSLDSVKRERPRYMKMKFSESCAMTWKINFVVS